MKQLSEKEWKRLVRLISREWGKTEEEIVAWINDDDAPTWDGNMDVDNLEWSDRLSDLLADVRFFYTGNPTGGNLHVCLDDGNMSDGNVWWCLQHASGKKDLEAVRLACRLLSFTEEERDALYERYDEYTR
jgi:hypothetical protein